MIVPPSTPANANDPFRRTGEMGRRIAERDWATTTLGKPDGWPRSFQTTVGTILGSRYPMILLWGPDLLQFYNDAYIGLIGAKHPDALGKSIRETQAESWSAIGPMIHEVMSTGVPNWVPAQQLPLQRSGYLEESYFSLSYSAVDDDEGVIRGMLCVCSEVTEQIVSARRMKLLRELAAASEMRSRKATCERVSRIIADHPLDVPFAALYLRSSVNDRDGDDDDDGNDDNDDGDRTHRLELYGQANVPQNLVGASKPFPEHIHLAPTRSPKIPLPFFFSAAHGENITNATVLIEDVANHVQHTGGPFQDRVRTALVMPIASSDPQVPLGVLIAAVSPARELDDGYRTFYELLAGQVSTLMQNAVAFEEERQRAEALAEVDRVKTAFFSNVSHELRTPLTLILGPIEDALAEVSGSASSAVSLDGENLRLVHRNALRLLRLVNSLLDFSRAEAGREQARFERTDLALLTAGLAGSFQSLMEGAGLNLVIDCAPFPSGLADLGVYVDRSHWEKIVLNLISNAFKFTFEGEIAVRLRPHPDGSTVELSVSDTGTGIPKDEINKVFDRFHRVEGARGRSFEGTGIGLALVQELVRQHGGAVHVESVIGAGSTFIVKIPTGTAHLPADRIVAPEPHEQHAAATAATGHGTKTKGATPYLLEAAHWDLAQTGASSKASTAPPASASASASPSASASASLPVVVVEHTQAPARTTRILVADDNADMRAYLVRLLSPKWTVEAVADGQAALEAALREPPDLVLSDVMMPRMDGVALLRALRSDSRTSLVPLILLSARAGEEAIVGGIETGADDYLVKPFSARELLSRVGTHLELARARDAVTRTANALAETRAALLEDLEHKNAELEAFSYSVSHDLRAPLRSISGFGHVLLEDHGEALGVKGREHLSRVRTATERMGRLIDDLLKLSRAERAELRRESVDLSSLARRIGESLSLLERDERGAAKAADDNDDDDDDDNEVELVVADGLVVDADARLVEILLENLLGNAWKFTKKNRASTNARRRRVELGSLLLDETGAATPTAHTFFVRDNGAGFESTAADQLFRPFRRLHSADAFPGTGIGLATVNRIVRRHGGRAWAEGKTNEGATIYWTMTGSSPSRGT